MYMQDWRTVSNCLLCVSTTLLLYLKVHTAGGTIAGNGTVTAIESPLEVQLHERHALAASAVQLGCGMCMGGRGPHSGAADIHINAAGKLCTVGNASCVGHEFTHLGMVHAVKQDDYMGVIHVHNLHGRQSTWNHL